MLLKPRPLNFRKKVKSRIKVSKKLTKEMKAKTFRPVAKPRYTPVDKRPSFDIPVTYNQQVKKWMHYFQNNGKKWFQRWLDRSHRYLPNMQKVLRQKNLPQDLAYIAMIESGFSPHAVSTASAVGYWQFIRPTANRYGLKTDWWIDERRDFHKSTDAASKYLGDLYKMFNSWYLTASAYNMGETRMRRLIKRHKTKNFWHLSKKKDFPKETREYIPKMLAAMLIAKSPETYGFNSHNKKKPYRYEYFFVPGGTDLILLAEALNLPHVEIKKLNPDILRGYIPKYVKNHRIRIPKGYTLKVASLIKNDKI